MQATKRQLWALFCATKEDYRDTGLTKEEASQLLESLNQCRIHWTKQKVIDVIREARQAGIGAAETMLYHLEDAGPRYAVCEETQPFSGIPKKVVGTMLDVCGSAHLKIQARGNFYLIAKKLSEEDKTLRFFCCRAYYGGGQLVIFDSTPRQELAVNKAAAQAHANVLAKYGIEATVETYID